MPTGPFRIFEDGKLKPGIYKIQNLRSETYLDVLQHSKEVCCRPARDLGAKSGLVRPSLSSSVRVPDAQKWEIKPLGIGYTIQRVNLTTQPDPFSYVERCEQVEPGKPEQFFAPREGLDNGAPLIVTGYPVAWRVEVVDDEIHRGYEYVRSELGVT